MFSAASSIQDVATATTTAVTSAADQTRHPLAAVCLQESETLRRGIHAHDAAVSPADGPPVRLPAVPSVVPVRPTAERITAGRGPSVGEGGQAAAGDRQE